MTTLFLLFHVIVICSVTGTVNLYDFSASFWKYLVNLKPIKVRRSWLLTEKRCGCADAFWRCEPYQSEIGTEQSGGIGRCSNFLKGLLIIPSKILLLVPPAHTRSVLLKGSDLGAPKVHYETGWESSKRMRKSTPKPVLLSGETVQNTNTLQCWDEVGQEHVLCCYICAFLHGKAITKCIIEYEHEYVLAQVICY